MPNKYRKSKYRNTKVTVDGVTFDSRKEARRWQELSLMEKSGTVSDLQRQVRIELIPAQRADGKVVERAAHYIADFVYTKDGAVVVEDTKGYRTPDYILKRKLMFFLHGVRIREV